MYEVNIKKKTGIAVDELGQVVNRIVDKEVENDPNSTILNNGRTDDKPKKVYNSTDNYKPTGKLVYNPDFFEKIEKKFN